MALLSKLKSRKIFENITQEVKKIRKNIRVNEQSIIPIFGKRSHSSFKTSKCCQQKLNRHNRNVSRKNISY
jgi:hypothetical protein